MINKFIFIALAAFGFSSVADMTEVDHMSDMMSNSGEEDGFMGSVGLKYMLNEQENLSYRARLGWHGDVNEDIHWGMGLSSDLEQNFQSPGLNKVNLEQFYVSYSPVEALSITAGKKGWWSKFHKTGVLYDERLYPGGVSLKYRHGEGEDTSVYAKLGLYWLGTPYNKPLIAGETLKAKVGGKFALSEDMKLGVFVSALHDGLFINKKNEGAAAVEKAAAALLAKTAKEAADAVKLAAETTEAAAAKKQEAQTLAQVGLNLSTSGMMAVPAGLFAVYVTNVKDMTSTTQLDKWCLCWKCRLCFSRRNG